MLYPGSFILTSTMYPVEVFEEAAISPPTFGAEIWEQPLDAADVAAPTFSGTHVQTLFSGSYSLDDYVEVASPTFSGAHVQTLFSLAYAMPPEDFTETASPTFSGSHIQTLFPLAYAMPPEDFSQTAPPTFTGSLV